MLGEDNKKGGGVKRSIFFFFFLYMQDAGTTCPWRGSRSGRPPSAKARAAEAVDGEDLRHRHAMLQGDPIERVAVLDRSSSVAGRFGGRLRSCSSGLGGTSSPSRPWRPSVGMRISWPRETFARGESELAEASDATETPVPPGDPGKRLALFRGVRLEGRGHRGGRGGVGDQHRFPRARQHFKVVSLGLARRHRGTKLRVQSLEVFVLEGPCPPASVRRSTGRSRRTVSKSIGGASTTSKP